MSWLSKATGIHLGNIGGPIGFGLGSLVGMPQLGAAIGQGAGALGQHKSLGRAAMEGAGAYAGGKLLGGGGAPSSASLSGIPGAGGISEAISSHGGLSGLAGGAFDWAKSHPSEILAGLQVANSASLGRKANQYADKAYGSANQSYLERAGLRKAGIEGMLHPEVPDLGQGSDIRGSNPYSLPLARAA